MKTTLVALTAALAVAAPATASLHLVTVSGSLAYGYDGTGAFGEVVFDAQGNQKYRDLTGHPFTAQWIYDTALGRRSSCCGTDALDGGPQSGIGLPSPVVSASITVDGATYTFAPAERGQARVDSPGGSNGPFVRYNAKTERRIGTVDWLETAFVDGITHPAVPSLDADVAQGLDVSPEAAGFGLSGYNSAGPGNYLGGNWFLHAGGKFSATGLTYSVTGLTAVHNGMSAATPLLPGSSGAGGFGFSFGVTPGQRVYIDPAMAVGYDYRVDSGPNILSALFPLIPGDADGYDVLGFNSVSNVYDVALGHATGGVAFNFAGAGVSRFGVRGIGGTPPLDPANATAFVTGLTFARAGAVTLYQTPVVAGAVPEPAGWALLIAGFAFTGTAARHRRASVAA